ncbi:MAG: hypothetical protein ACRCSU_10715, partial [Paracoccaceae bacterium]
MEYQFGPWLPDVTDLKNPGLEECTNVIPSPGGYQPAAGLGSQIATVGAAVISAAMFERADGTRVTVCATASDLHVIIGAAVTNSALALTLTEHVTFVRFGDEIYATEKTGGTWKLTDIDSDTTFSAVANVMPSAKTMFRVGDFLFMGNLTDIDASDRPFRLRWSRFNDPASDWTASVAFQAASVNMPTDFGPIIAGAGYNYGIILQRYGISRIVYTGGATVFAKEIVDKERGCASTASVVTVGDSVYFLSDDGFFVTNGGPAQSISRGRIWDWFIERVGQSYFYLVKGAVDWPKRCVVWSVPDANGNSIGLLYFNWESQNWSYVNQPVDCVYGSGKDGLTLEQVAAIYPNLDTMPLSLDSPQFKARGRLLAAFSSGSLKQFDGTTLAVTLGTGEFQPTLGRRTFVSSVTPLITNNDESTTVVLSGRDRQTDLIVSTTDMPTGPVGFAGVNFDARYFSVKINIPAGANWRDAYGFQLEG